MKAATGLKKQREWEMESKSEWSAIQWEEYLETLESPQTELILDNPNLVEAMSEETFREGVANLMGTNYSPKLNRVIALMMDALTDKQRNVLNLIYWESKSLREVAGLLGINFSSARDIRDRGLANLSKIMIKSVVKPNQPGQHDDAA